MLPNNVNFQNSIQQFLISSESQTLTSSDQSIIGPVKEKYRGTSLSCLYRLAKSTTGLKCRFFHGTARGTKD